MLAQYANPMQLEYFYINIVLHYPVALVGTKPYWEMTDVYGDMKSDCFFDDRLRQLPNYISKFVQYCEAVKSLGRPNLEK